MISEETDIVLALLYLTMEFPILCHVLSLDFSTSGAICFQTAEVTVMYVANGCYQNSWKGRFYDHNMHKFHRHYHPLPLLYVNSGNASIPDSIMKQEAVRPSMHTDPHIRLSLHQCDICFIFRSCLVSASVQLYIIPSNLLTFKLTAFISRKNYI